MKPIYIKLIDNSSDHWIEATVKNYIVYLFQKHKEKLGLDNIIHYLQTDLDLQIRDKTFVNSILVEIDSSEYNSSQFETINKWNEVILHDTYDSFESEVMANLEIGNHKQFWKEYQWYVFYPIVKKAFYKYANRNFINQNLEIYNKSISEEFKKITAKHSNNESISNFIKKITSKEKISLSYFLLFIKYFYIIEFLKGNVKLEDQADIENYLRDYLDVQIFYFFEVFNTSVKLESYFSKSAESLSSILVDDTLKKNFDNEKRLRETFDALIKEHSSKIEEYFSTNTEKINEILKTALEEKKNIINLSGDIDRKHLEFQKEMNSQFNSMFIRAKDKIDEYLKIHNLRLDEILKSNSQQQQQMQSVNIAINQKQIDLEKKVKDIADYEKRIEKNLKNQVVLFSKRDLNNRQKAFDNAKRSYKTKRTIYKKQKSINKRRPVIFGLAGIFSILFAVLTLYLFLNSEIEQVFLFIFSGISVLLFITFIVGLSRFISAREFLNDEKDFLLEDNKELLESRKDLRDLAKNFNRDTESSYNAIFNVEHMSGVQVGSSNSMDNKNTQNFRDTQAPFKVTDFSKE
ncbi:MAG: hypothetical protein KBA66_19990 [Leptospiraceae bacterium]|nr:hypothetical protein [Leptospiraceae bacterium]